MSPQRQIKQGIHASEERLRLALEAGQLGTCDYDLTHNTLYYDERCRTILGLTSEGSLKAEQASRLIHPDDFDQLLTVFFKATDPVSSGRFDIELRIIWPDGSVRWVKAQGQIMFEAEGDQRRAVRLIGVIEDITGRKADEAEREWLLQELQDEQTQLKAMTETLEEQVARRTEQVRALASALTLAEQQERSRISQVLHDDLQQLLYGLLLRLNIHKDNLPDGQLPTLTDQIAQSIQLVEQAVNITRSVVSELTPPVLKLEELTDALGWLARHTESMYQLKVQLSIREQYRISYEAQTLLLQIVRELLFNVVKHAKASQASIELHRENGTIIIQMLDDGQGFDVEEVRTRQRKQGGYGLSNIQERLALIGGRLEIDSRPGRGTRMKVLMPVA